ncbi:MAG: hypothetical protein JWP04_1701, partial [Belnapia sp.]|nr:hypothetical protein [Belnapia sp.]
FTDLPLDRVVDWLVARPAGAPFGYVVTPNADHLVRLARNPAIRPLYAESELKLLDSRVVARLARLVGLPVPAVVPGSDLTARLIEQAIDPDEPVTILGLAPEAMAQLAARTGLRRIAHHNPPMGFEHDPAAFEAAVGFIEAHPARFTFLAVGSPRQCMVANALVRRGRARGMGLCIGASLLFLTGEERRAPVPVQRAGLEWAWRLAQDPRRLARRYLVDSPAIIALLRREARERRSAA